MQVKICRLNVSIGIVYNKISGEVSQRCKVSLIFISVIFYGFRREQDLDIICEAYVYIISFLFTVMTRSFFGLILSLTLKQLSFSNRNLSHFLLSARTVLIESYRTLYVTANVRLKASYVLKHTGKYLRFFFIKLLTILCIYYLYYVAT